MNMEFRNYSEVDWVPNMASKKQRERCFFSGNRTFPHQNLAPTWELCGLRWHLSQKATCFFFSPNSPIGWVIRTPNPLNPTFRWSCVPPKFARTVEDVVSSWRCWTDWRNEDGTAKLQDGAMTVSSAKWVPWKATIYKVEKHSPRFLEAVGYFVLGIIYWLQESWVQNSGFHLIYPIIVSRWPPGNCSISPW